MLAFYSCTLLSSLEVHSRILFFYSHLTLTTGGMKLPIVLQQPTTVIFSPFSADVTELMTFAPFFATTFPAYYSAEFRIHPYCISFLVCPTNYYRSGVWSKHYRSYLLLLYVLLFGLIPLGKQIIPLHSFNLDSRCAARGAFLLNLCYCNKALTFL